MATIIQTASQDRLRGVTPTVTAGTIATGYSASTFALGDPARRVRFTGTSGTLSFSFSSARIDVVTIPMHNATSITITVSGGMNVSPTLPSARANGFPNTFASDVSLLDTSTSNRTGTSMTVGFSGASGALILGGAIAAYGPKTTSSTFQWGYSESEEHRTIEHTNIYGTTLRYDLQAALRTVEGAFELSSDTERETLRDWFRANHGPMRPSLLWLDSTDNGVSAYYGTWDGWSMTRHFTNVNSIPVTFHEMGKGVSLV